MSFLNLFQSGRSPDLGRDIFIMFFTENTDRIYEGVEKSAPVVFYFSNPGRTL